MTNEVILRDSPSCCAERSGVAASSSDILRVENLAVQFQTDGAPVQAVRGITYDLAPGEVLAIVGESGSGKTVGTRAFLGLLPDTAAVSGTAKLDEMQLVGLKGEQIRRVRGDRIAMIFQEPSTALDPVRTIGWQIIEALSVHRKLSRKEAREKAVELLDLVGIPDPSNRLHSYPHQLSGGQKQRVMIAMAISCDPEVIVADEPTTALDVTVQAQILDLLHDLRDRLGTAIILITHNMGVVADMADRVAVMYRGQIVETAPARDIFERPQHPYTKHLLASVPHLGQPRPKSMDTPAERVGDAVVMRVNDVRVDFPGRFGAEPVHAVAGVSLEVREHEIVALVGESGSGKTTLGRCAVGLQPVTGGDIEVLGVNIVKASAKELQRFRRRVGFVFQDPAASLNPRMSVADCIAEPMVIHGIGTKAERLAKAQELLRAVELPADYAFRYPHELSGGQRQRVSLARALVTDPEFVVADEPTSALDVSVQARVLEVFVRLQHDMGFACLFVTHDLAVVDMLADRIAVMRQGEIVELGTREQVLRAPQEDYTRELIAAVPVPDSAEQTIRRLARREGRFVGL
ncbi:MAG: ABC transporter ATP-binding protein [Propionibacteriaceae bacterium]|jgi:ABC-type glutathione transport system ATPase component|nr:ABC transporter ATP-binding protein [Propionibacteriaceae bacterium]